MKILIQALALAVSLSSVLANAANPASVSFVVTVRSATWCPPCRAFEQKLVERGLAPDAEGLRAKQPPRSP